MKIILRSRINEIRPTKICRFCGSNKHHFLHMSNGDQVTICQSCMFTDATSSY